MLRRKMVEPGGPASAATLTVATASFGHIGEFKPDNERFSVYVERFELFLAANGVQDSRKVPLFLTMVGGTTYGLLHNLVAPSNPKDMSYEDIVSKLRAHFEPKPLIITKRFLFHRRDQKPGESIAEYLAELRRLASGCAFQGEQLTEALRDRLVCGMRSEATQKRLLSESDPSLDRVLEVSQGMEAAEENARVLRSTEEPVVGRVTPDVQQKPATSVTGGACDRSDVQQNPATPASGGACYRCGKTGHKPQACGFKEAICHHCGKKGHIRRACKSRRNTQRPVEAGNISSGSAKWVDMHEETAFRVTTRFPPRPYKVLLQLNGQTVPMEVDTGAAVSLMSVEMQRRLFPSVTLNPATILLRTYTTQQITVLGQIDVEVQYQLYCGKHTLTIVSGDGPALLGRDWLQHIRLDWANIGVVSAQAPSMQLAQVLDHFSDVFQSGLGTITPMRAHLMLAEGATPKFKPPRTVPFAIREAVEKELDRLEAEGILQRVDYSAWAAPIVPVHKKDGTIRVCGDYKLTVNPYLLVDQYPLPNTSDLLSSLAGGKRFTKLDLTSAYQQMMLDEESAQLLTINTQKGLYRYTRMPFGVASAPAIFQRTMDTILQGLPQVFCYLDDILVTGDTDESHLENLTKTLERLQQHGIRLKREKCRFFQESVEYLGHVLSSKGVHTSPEKVRAVLEQPAPQNVAKLRSFLGQINYYAKFIGNLSTLLAPLHHLTRKGQPWNWTEECQRAFEEANRQMSEAPVLAHFDPKLPITLAADASSYGVGAVISHIMPDGSERPIAFASRTLSVSERNYAQIEKEALGLIFGVKKFHQFLYGRRFLLITDHKPLTTILGPKCGVPPLAAARMQRWALLLSAYSYEIRYRSTTAHGNADGLSRLPLPDSTPDASSVHPTSFNIGQLNSLPIQSSQVQNATQVDPLLKKVLKYTKKGWPRGVPESLRPFRQRQQELSIESGCLLWGTRVVVPRVLQQHILEELHRGHPGIVRMKSLARSHVWWPTIDRQLEDVVKSCVCCQSNRHQPVKAPLHPWAWPAKPWQRIHLDFAGPVVGKMLFIAVDAHSKWPEVILMESTTTSKTIRVLQDMFARWGIPEQIVTDNGPQFISSDFTMFLTSHGVKHIRTAPYHPASNGAAERVVQTVKQALRAGLQAGDPIEECLASFLLRYRNTQHATTGVAPSELMVGRHLRTRLDLLRDQVATRVQDSQEKQNSHSPTRNLQVGQRVWVRNYRSGPRWIPGIVEEVKGPVSYIVRILETDELWHRHLNQIREREADTSSQLIPAQPSQTSDLVGLPVTAATDGNRPQPPTELARTETPSEDSCTTPPTASSTATPEQRYPSRQRRPPDRLMWSSSSPSN